MDTNDGRSSQPRCYSFGSYVLDAHKSLLWRKGELVPLTPKAVEVLTVLVERAGRVITKDELFALVWPGTTVEENNLARHVSTLRKALGERRDQHDYIVTVPGHGYRFVATVDRVERDAGLAAEVEAVRESPSPALSTAPQVPLRWTRIAASVVAVSVVAVVVFLAVSGTWRQSAEEPPSIRPFTYGPGLQHQPAWSPDGQQVAFAADTSGNSDIWVQSMNDPIPRRLTSSPSEEWQPAWSPDGRWIAYRSEREGGGIFMVPAAGGEERRLAASGFRPRWSPSGTLVLFSGSLLEVRGSEFFIVGLDGQAPRRLRPDVLTSMYAAHVAWHPREDRVAVWGRGRSSEHFLVVPVDGSPERSGVLSPVVRERIRQTGVELRRFVWSPSGRYLYFEGQTESATNIWRVTVDPETFEWVSGPDQLTKGTGRNDSLALAPDGTRLAFSAREEKTRVWSLPFDSVGGRLTGPGLPLTSGGPGEYDAAAPLDGSRIAFRTVRGGRQEIWERSVENGHERLLISSRDVVRTSPRWSADGQLLAYRRRSTSGDDDTTASIGILSQSSGQERLLASPPDLDLVPDDWSRDGSTILAACRPKAAYGHGICVVPAVPSAGGGADVKVLAAEPGYSLICPRFSPDERWVSFMAVQRGREVRSTLYVMPATGGPWTKITDGGSYDDKPRWGADGRSLYFVSDRAGFPNLWGRRFDPDSGEPSGEPFRVTSFESPGRLLEPRMGRVEIAVTRERVFLPVTESTGEIWLLTGLDP